MQTRLEPPIDQWPTPTDDRRIWTGHQLSLFHPGIVTKYLAAQEVSDRVGVAFANIVVDQDVYDPLTITLPQRDRSQPDRLVVQRYALGRIDPEVPVGMRPAVATEEIEARLADLPSDAGIERDALRKAFAGTDALSSLAAQMDTVLRRLLPAFAAAAPSVFATQLLADEAAIVEALLHHALACAKHYNAAVNYFPGVGMTAMRIEPDRVEVPLWALRWMKPRQRVYVDIADSTPIFVTDDGEPLAPGRDGVTLAPRALLMTALLRRTDRCGLFIHGTGGWSYDRITEQWWQEWQGETLAPMALATADVFLDFGGLPVNSRDDVEHAVWRAHHLPHNLDRALNLDDTPAREKRELLARMDDDRDQARRRAAFELVHQINRDLAEQHPEAIAEAREAVERAKVGVANAAIAGKRDWSFLLYPPEKLETLRERIAYPLTAPSAAKP